MARAVGTATTLDEVAQLAGRLRTELRRCGMHAEVVRYCEEEVLRRSLFHAVSRQPRASVTGYGR
ncbi:hypothetical protein [Micromonospora sp. L5]|uniref:hypothetical protein n=1 Tax=Micromonospora sp. (strain L5) TaxID=648999 RepID=UPI00117D2B0D|nr:hypothetical protein [Micromonospora sp. L5]